MITVEANGKTFDFPDGTTSDQIGAGIDEYFAQQKQVATEQPQNSAQQEDTLLDDALDVAGEFAAGVNRGLVGIADFIGPDTVNAVLSLAGSDVRIPTFKEGLKSTGIEGGFMEPGTAREVVRAAGETIPAAVGAGQVLRTGASRLPALTSGPAPGAESVAAGTLREAARTTPQLDAGAAALSGAGAAIGEEIGGQTGALVGGVTAPLAVAPFVGGVSLLKNARRGTVPMPDQQLIQAGEDAGIPILTTDVRPPTTAPGRQAQQTGEKIPITGTATLRQGQQEAREEASRRFVEQYGDFSYENIVNSLKENVSRVKRAAGSVMESVGKQLDDVGEIPTNRTLDSIETAQNELARSNVIRSSDADRDLDALLDVLLEPQTFTTLQANRTAFRELVKATDNADRSQLTSRAKSLLQRVEDAMTADMSDFAEQNLNPREFQQWRRANAVYAEQADVLRNSRLKNVLDRGDITPESARTLLFSQNPSEVRLLYNSLTQQGRENARAAIISRVVNDLNRRASGFSPNSFANELKKYETTIGTFFRGEEGQRLEGLRRVLNATRRAQDAAVTTPTGQQLIGGASIAALMFDPTGLVGTAGTVGALSRLYESAAVRNALLRLGSVPPGSDKYVQAVLNAQTALAAAAERERQQQQATEPPRPETQ